VFYVGFVGAQPADLRANMLPSPNDMIQDVRPEEGEEQSEARFIQRHALSSNPCPLSPAMSTKACQSANFYLWLDNV